MGRSGARTSQTTDGGTKPEQKPETPSAPSGSSKKESGSSKIKDLGVEVVDDPPTIADDALDDPRTIPEGEIVRAKPLKSNGLDDADDLDDDSASQSEEGPPDTPDPVFLTEEQFINSAPPGRMVCNGYAISATPEDRKPLAPGQLTAKVWIREIRHPAIKAGPDDDLADFAPI